jgi:hypothetical protein
MLDDRRRAAAPFGRGEGQGGLERRTHNSHGESSHERGGRAEYGVEDGDAVAGRAEQVAGRDPDLIEGNLADQGAAVADDG